MMRSLVLKSVRACNLRCGYCYYINDKTPGYGESFSDDLVDRIYETYAEHVDWPGESVNLIWHGGEPLLLGRRRLGRFIERQAHYFKYAKVHNRLQTNGVLIDDAWADFFRRHDVSVGISIDGPPDLHDRLRPTVKGKGSWQAVARGIAILRAHRIPFGVITVADPQLADRDLWQTIIGEQFHYFDLLIPITNNALQAECPDQAVDMAAVGRVLTDTFQSWVARDDDSYHIRLFEALLTNAIGGRHNCSNAGLRDEALGAYAIVETDGEICFDAEFSEIDRNGLGAEYSTGLRVTDPGFSFDAAFDAIRTRMKAARMDEMPAACADCHVATICRGSHPGSRYGSDGSYAHRSAYCDAMRPLGEAVAAYMNEHGMADVLV
ncbi:radical SAM protein [Sphingomonas sp.]|uniref:radical SAM protein n=1 Tax=Sphingomonas sp. TaxID=28214 RepID=UPI0025F05C4E|nr:radical SAM protein [Sphingomonas sp.]